DEPPVEEWRREGFADVEAAAPTAPVEPPPAPPAPPTTSAPAAPAAADAPSYEAPPTIEVPPAYEAPTYQAPPTIEVPPSYEAPTYQAPPTIEVPPSYEAPAADDSHAEAPPPPIADAPLPTRVPGQHLTHHPVVNGEASAVDADPMR